MLQLPAREGNQCVWHPALKHSRSLDSLRVIGENSRPLGGRLAQLGERCSHIAEVTGSNPVSPTTFGAFGPKSDDQY